MSPQAPTVAGDDGFRQNAGRMRHLLPRGRPLLLVGTLLIGIVAWNFPYAIDDAVRREDEVQAFYDLTYAADGASPLVHDTAMARAAVAAKETEDIRGAVEWNGILERARDVIAAAEQPGVHANVAAAAAALKLEIGRTKKRPVRLRVLAPQDWYGEENSGTAFSPKLIRKAIRHGREIARDPGRWLLA